MPETDQFHSELPNWDSASEQAGRENARRLAERVCQRAASVKTVAGDLAVHRVGICGCGIMGAGIAVENVRHQIPVHLYDADPEAVKRTVDRLRREFGPACNSDSDPSGSSQQLVYACQQQSELADCDLIIESVVENRELKQQILKQLAGHLSPQALLTTNTSTIPVGELAAELPEPGRFCGLHFCNPVPQRRLVEIVRGPGTSSQTVAAAMAYVAQIGKLPIVVQDSPGFLVNRLLLAYLNESLEMVCQGADPRSLDQAARAFGMAMGPIEFLDVIGIDTAIWAGRRMWEAFPDRITLTPVLPALMKRNRLGLKTGLGFYRYGASDLPDGARRGELDPEIAPEIDPDLAPILAPYIRRARRFTPQEITLRLFLPMLVEATRVIQEKVVEDVSDVDVGLLYGLAFPASRGGLLFWADSLGAAAIVEFLKPFEPLGKRMHPTQMLLGMAQSGERFYRPAV